jgi:integrase
VVTRGAGPSEKTFLVRTAMEALLATCDGSLAGLRNRALLAFRFASGGRRRSELFAADLSDLRLIGLDQYV